MTRDGLLAEVRDTLDRLASGAVSREQAERELVLSAGAYAAVQVEKHARPHPWPPPMRPRLDEARAAGRQQQSSERKTA